MHFMAVDFVANVQIAEFARPNAPPFLALADLARRDKRGKGGPLVSSYIP
jgi:hypothetical protein